MTQRVNISGDEIDVIGAWLGVDVDEDDWDCEAWLVPLYGVGLEIDRSGYILFAHEVKAGTR